MQNFFAGLLQKSSLETALKNQEIVINSITQGFAVFRQKYFRPTDEHFQFVKTIFYPSC